MRYSQEGSNRKGWRFVGYVAAFFSVYAAALLGSLVPNISNQAGWTEITIPTQAGWNYYANATMTTSATSSWMPVIGIALVGAAVIGVLTSAFAFNVAAG